MRHRPALAEQVPPRLRAPARQHLHLNEHRLFSGGNGKGLEGNLERQRLKSAIQSARLALVVSALRDAKEAYAHRYIREVLELNNGNRSKTARDLGVDPRTIYKYREGK